MSWSFKLFTVRGIPIRVHVSFLLVLVWAVYIGQDLHTGNANWLQGVTFMVLLTLLLFACVVLHELGHSLVAQVFDVKVHDITLWPIGGVARIMRMPERPYQEFLIAAAGPAVNIFLTFFLLAVALVWTGPERLLQPVLAVLQGDPIPLSLDGQAMILLLAVNNALLVLFNLIPAFPMDGGRLLRAFLAAFMPFGRATQVASWLGQGAAVFMGLAALLTASFFLGLVAAFIFVAAWGERQQVVSSDYLRGLRVRQAMQPVGIRLHPLDTLGEAAGRIAASPQAAWLVVDGGRLVGILSRRDLLAALKKAGASARIAQHVAREFLRLSPDDALMDVTEQLAPARPSIGVVIEDGQVIGLLGRGDIARLAEVLAAHPGALPKT